MNEDTRISIHCYAGDIHQVNFDLMHQHGCPITILSPEDSRAEVSDEDCKFGGKRAYVGQDSLDRQVRHMELLLEYPENHFLMHDSDSILLDAKIPDYLYAEPDFVWSNQVIDAIPEHQPFFPDGWPHVAFQPPYFMSRKIMQALVTAAKDPRAKANECMPFIDFFMMQLTMIAGVPWRRLNDCVSCQISADPLKEPTMTPELFMHHEAGFRLASDAINKGCQILHSVKNPAAAALFVEKRKAYLAGHPHALPMYRPAPVIGPARGRRQGRHVAFADPRNLKA